MMLRSLNWHVLCGLLAAFLVVQCLREIFCGLLVVGIVCEVFGLVVVVFKTVPDFVEFEFA